MSRFEVGSIKERKLAWGKIIFSNKYHITVQTPTMTIIFHRYGAPRGQYYLWSNFKQALSSRKLEDIYDIYKYANRFDIIHYVKEVHNSRSKNG